MHKIDHSTATPEGTFTEGSPEVGTPATKVTADIMNAMMLEIVNTVESAGLTLNKSDNTQLSQAISLLYAGIADKLNPVGKIEFLMSYSAPSATNPRFCLSLDDQTLLANNWPDLVAYMRSLKFKYNEGLASEVAAFTVSGYARATNVMTVTLVSNAANNALLAALAEDYTVHGSYTGWRTIFVPAFDTVAAGDYAITDINAENRTISFAHTGSDVSQSASFNVEFYRHRLPTSVDTNGTQARHYKIQGRAFVTNNDSDGFNIAGLRRRDRLQGHIHTFKTTAGTESGTGYGENMSGITNNTLNNAIGNPIDDGTNGTPRTGKYTEPRSMGVVPYVYGKRYIA